MVELDGPLDLVSWQNVPTNLDVMATEQPEDGALAELVLGGQVGTGDTGLVVGKQLLECGLVKPLSGPVDMSCGLRSPFMPLNLLGETPDFQGSSTLEYLRSSSTMTRLLQPWISA